jgi:CRISPR-associated endonuclease Csn1
VDVQKGKITSDFRKVLGIQDDDTLKVRDSNSHHAIDAMVLTFIPVAVRRDEILEKFYERKELKDLGHDVSHIDKEIKLLLIWEE